MEDRSKRTDEIRDGVNHNLLQRRESTDEWRDRDKKGEKRKKKRKRDIT